MKEVQTAEDLMEQLSNMNNENYVCQVEAEKTGHAMSVSELIRNPFF
jgi:hypothetical protein